MAGRKYFVGLRGKEHFDVNSGGARFPVQRIYNIDTMTVFTITQYTHGI